MAHFGASQAKGSGGVRVYEYGGRQKTPLENPNASVRQKIRYGVKQAKREAEREHRISGVRRIK
jgi:hypothetical protein